MAEQKKEIKRIKRQVIWTFFKFVMLGVIVFLFMISIPKSTLEKVNNITMAMTTIGGGGAMAVEIGNFSTQNSTWIIVADDNTTVDWNESRGNATYLAINNGKDLINSTWANNTYVNKTGYNKTAWDIAWSWGNHSKAGYLTTESDPQVGEVTANRHCVGNGTSVECNDSNTYLTTESDPVFVNDNTSIWIAINNKLANTGGTINGNVIINGNVSVVGSYVNLTVVNEYINGSVYPNINNTFNLGTPELLYNNIYGFLNWTMLINIPYYVANYTFDIVTANNTATKAVADALEANNTAKSKVGVGSYQCADTTNKIYNITLSASGLTALCAADNIGNGTADNNNYSTSVEVTGTTTKTIIINRTGMESIQANFTDLNTGSGDGTGSWINTTTMTTTQKLVNVTTNITAWGYFIGQPLLGMLGSGIIHSEQTNALSEINLTCSGLVCTYNSFIVRLVFGSSDQFSVYCNMTNATVTVTDNQQNVIYINNTCGVKTAEISDYFTNTIGQGGVWDIGNVVAYAGTTEVVNGIGLEQRRMMKQRVINFYKNHLSVVSGFGRTMDVFPSFTINAGKYIYLMDVVDAGTHNTSTAESVEVIYHNGTTGWIVKNETNMNITQCDNGTTTIACSTPTKYRRIFFFMVGYNESDSDKSGIHQLLARDSISYSTVGDCLDIVTNPITYTLPSWYTYSAVPLWAYCVRAGDSAWTNNWIDLRVTKTSTATGTIDTSIFLTIDGSRALTNNWDTGNYNITAKWFKGNGSLLTDTKDTNDTVQLISEIGLQAANNATQRDTINSLNATYLPVLLKTFLGNFTNNMDYTTTAFVNTSITNLSRNINGGIYNITTPKYSITNSTGGVVLQIYSNDTDVIIG